LKEERSALETSTVNEFKEEWTLRKIVAYALIGLGVLLALNLLLHALPILIGVAVLLGPPIWVYVDGTKRGLDRAPLWALLVLLSTWSAWSST